MAETFCYFQVQLFIQAMNKVSVQVYTWVLRKVTTTELFLLFF